MTLKVKYVIELLIQHGWVLVRMKGDHRIIINLEPEGRLLFLVT